MIGQLAIYLTNSMCGESFDTWRGWLAVALQTRMSVPTRLGFALSRALTVGLSCAWTSIDLSPTPPTMGAMPRRQRLTDRPHYVASLHIIRWFKFHFMYDQFTNLLSYFGAIGQHLFFLGVHIWSTCLSVAGFSVLCIYSMVVTVHIYIVWRQANITATYTCAGSLPFYTMVFFLHSFCFCWRYMFYIWLVFGFMYTYWQDYLSTVMSQDEYIPRNKQYS